MHPTDRRIVVGAELYCATGDQWKVVPPKRVTVVDANPVRIVTRRQGPFTIVSHVADDAGSAIVVRFDDGTVKAVPARHLRGLWLETLAATGRTVAGVKAHGARIAEIAATPGPVDLGAVLRAAACDEVLDDDVFTAIARAVDPQGD